MSYRLTVTLSSSSLNNLQSLSDALKKAKMEEAVARKAEVEKAKKEQEIRLRDARRALPDAVEVHTPVKFPEYVEIVETPTFSPARMEGEYFLLGSDGWYKINHISGIFQIWPVKIKTNKKPTKWLFNNLPVELKRLWGWTPPTKTKVFEIAINDIPNKTKPQVAKEELEIERMRAQERAKNEARRKARAQADSELRAKSKGPRLSAPKKGCRS